MFVRTLSFYVLALVVCSTIVFHCEGAPIINSINLQQYSSIQLGWTRDQITKLIV
ncbi:unnamed protein product, partial [Adineta ricciae]